MTINLDQSDRSGGEPAVRIANTQSLFADVVPPRFIRERQKSTVSGELHAVSNKFPEKAGLKGAHYYKISTDTFATVENIETTSGTENLLRVIYLDKTFADQRAREVSQFSLLVVISSIALTGLGIFAAYNNLLNPYVAGVGSTLLVTIAVFFILLWWQIRRRGEHVAAR